MRYDRIYYRIIERGLYREYIDEYYERHHILPRCMGGDDSDDNIVRLTFKEHLLCHQLLAKMIPDDSDMFYSIDRFYDRTRKVYRHPGRMPKWVRRKLARLRHWYNRR